jgi:hypothetical protein
MAGRSGQYYRAGHWVNRSTGGRRRPKKKTWAGVASVALLLLGAKLGLFSGNGEDGNTTQKTDTPSATSSPARK